MTKSKVASIRALQELRGIVDARLDQTFNARLRSEEEKIKKLRQDLTQKIQDEIEEYAIKAYEQYGLKVVPLCHRSSGYKDSDIVRAELRIKDFPFDESALETAKKEKSAARQQVEDWYFASVQAVAKQVELPETPDFK